MVTATAMPKVAVDLPLNTRRFIFLRKPLLVQN